MEPTIGRTVIYKTTEADRKLMQESKSCNDQKELPAVIVATWGGDTANLKVNLDGEGDLWKTSVTKGDQEGMWHWPVIVPAATGSNV